ncbi:WSCD family member [Seminavis robusta]|uniref:WSCD family member n=1 Tax=Seminavis robusta TaxID=568900 RepID=A0A9N8HGD7_9STRA|nr:WSCD family member [Seminavis robusta]|eukprot:Sro626_g177760.1 WSCD family member (497) ;mRNA; r:20463-21953
MDTLDFYPLTIVLTYLGEVDGTRLLLTKKKYAKQILPMFQRRRAGNAERQERYRFQVSPVQDPVVLLQRLNTRRLKRRTLSRDSNSSKNGATTMSTDTSNGLSTVQRANWEWEEMYNSCKSKQPQQDKTDNNLPEFPFPPPLELLRFLDQIPTQPPNNNSPWSILQQNRGVTLLLSYPRSGNTLLRTLLERTTGIVTGSDTRPDRTLSKALAEAHNLVGEGVTHRTKTCFVKTHWPERTGWKIVTGHRAVMLIRNPFDAMDSYWNLNVTNTHTETVTDEIYQRFADKFRDMARNELQIWCRYHQYWIDRMELDDFSILWIRFEDLIQQPARELTRILEFVAAGNDKGSLDDHSFWQQRIRHATTTTTTMSSLGSYQPRSATKGVQSIGKSLHKGRYSPELLQELHQIAAGSNENNNNNLLARFGYDRTTQNFPQNFVDGKEPPIIDTSHGSSTVKVNVGTPVRPVNCPFGRLMREWRLQHTNNDTEPFPRVPRVAG